MEKKILSIGLVILVIGLFLMITFWPLFGTSAAEAAEKEEKNEFDDRESLRVYGTITEMIEIGDLTIIELDGELIIWGEGVIGRELSEGDSVYGDIVHNSFAGDYIAHWEIDGEIHSKTTIDYIFYSTIGIGVAIIAVSIVRD